MTPLLLTLFTCAVAFALASALVLTAARHGRFTMDAPGPGVQKVHCVPTPRVGGVGIYLALLLARAAVSAPDSRAILDTILVAGIPALAAGLWEDITKRAGVRLRLAATLASGAIASGMTGVALRQVDVPMVDLLLAHAPFALAFTAFAVGGVANAINLIDGFHGLASGATTISLLAVAAVANAAGDLPLAMTAATVAAAVAGFWLVNFPWGKLFLGDGGAYFAGFALAWLAVLLPMRNPSVSPWASLLICGYPVIEVLYSVLRRLRGRRSPGMADRDHLHSLVASRVVQRHLAGLDSTMQNSATSVLMWICAAFPAFVGVTYSEDSAALAVGAAACLLLYHWLYRFLARA